ncbi:AMP-binding protein [Bacillus thuringiensis]|uniref:2-acyl-glycerophospho-ethanolamine acyltransferase n=1 Tax=Bacillus thuringiensis TaxID=1428 RepID=A0A9X6WNF7_BACTU|nr:AMP-binding protein [Bacillus thuringiensis]PFJ38791.1 2-acyl-glycerophospho-ethanolamine acyltransferase [Bacillus thuringiensis]
MNIVENKNVIYMSNHVSIDDLATLHTTLPDNVRFITFDNSEFIHNESKLKNRKVTIFKQLDAEAVMKTIRLIETGEPVLLFPELKVSKAGTLLRIFTEMAFIAFKAKATIYPVFINGAGKNPNKFRFVENIVQTNKPFVKVGTPFTLSQFEKASGEKEKEKIAAFIHYQLNELKFSCLNKTNINLYNELLNDAKTYKDNEYIVKDTGASLSYNKLILNINVMSQRLEKLITEKRIGVLLPNAIAHVVTLYSLFKLGVSPAILNFTMGEQNLVDCCETAELKTIITSSAFVEKANLQDLLSILETKYKIIYLEEVKESINSVDKLMGLANNYRQQKANFSSNEVILFTSGSESKPKGVILTHDNIYANVQQALTSLDITTKDKMFNALPMFHSFGLSVGTFLPLITGIPVYLYPSPTHSKEIPRFIYQDDITLFISTPTFLTHYERYAHPFTFKDVKYIITGAEKLKPEIRDNWMSKFGIRILEGYGVTEAAPILALNTPLFNKTGSVGKIVPGMQHKIKPIEGIENGGSLLVKGPNLMKGYLIHGKGYIPLTDWYDTGDIVEIDENNFITIKSRLKRFAKIGGEMVSLNLVEELAAECFGHTGFAAVAIPDKRKGEKIILFTTKPVEESFLNTQERTFKKFIKSNKLSSLLIPSEIEVFENIPLLGSGKTDYVTIQKLAQERFNQ